VRLAQKSIAAAPGHPDKLDGLIVIDRSGQIGVSFNPPRMARLD
jgi:hypothetical protein